VLPHHARAAEQAALVNQMLQQRGLAPHVPYQYGAPAPSPALGAPGYAMPGAAPAANPAWPQTPMAELERLAAEGQQRHAELAARAAALANARGDDDLAVALGGHYGTPLLRGARFVQYAALVGLLASIALFASGLVDPFLAGPAAGACAVTAFVLLFLRVFWTPRASAAQRDAEASWQRSLPFTLTGYFEMLSAEPRVSCQVQVHLEWASPRVPAAQLVVGVVQRVDPGASPTAGDPSGWTSAAISGSTGILVNGVSVRRNHRIVKYVHELVDGVLLPLHRDYPLGQVLLRRSW
jgi:hypothetical protein